MTDLGVVGVLDEVDRAPKHPQLCASEGRTVADGSDLQKNGLEGCQEHLQGSVSQGGEKRLR